MGDLLECVANVSEGRREEVLAELAAACGDFLLDVHADPDHHRSVFTLAGQEHPLVDRVMDLARAVSAHVDVSVHTGVHPRLGALDVVPFVALTGPAERAVEAAGRFGSRLAAELAVPSFLYGAADPAGRSLPEVRRHAFAGRRPDFGPAAPHPTMGAASVGARPPLVAVNCEIEGADVAVARRLARQVRERDGGLPGVRALGLALPSRGTVQVSMNLVDLSATGVETACREVQARAEAMGLGVGGLELVGLVPEAELRRCSAEFLAWSGLGPHSSIEARLAERPAPPARTFG